MFSRFVFTRRISTIYISICFSYINATVAWCFLRFTFHVLILFISYLKHDLCMCSFLRIVIFFFVKIHCTFERSAHFITIIVTYYNYNYNNDNNNNNYIIIIIITRYCIIIFIVIYYKSLLLVITVIIAIIILSEWMFDRFVFRTRSIVTPR